MKLGDQKIASFTLVELLVVISVIGLLSSVVLLSFRGIRERARIAKMLDFSQSVQNALGSEAVGVWTFDDCAAKDSSGYGNDGVINGASCVGETPHSAAGQGEGKSALSFDGLNDYVQVPDSASLDVVDALTVTAWIRPNSGMAGRYGIVEKLFSNGNQPFALAFDGREAGKYKIHFRIFSGSWYETTQPGIILNGWNYVAVTVKNSVMSLHINGVPVGTHSAPASLPTNDGLLRIGFDDQENKYFSGLIDEVGIYETAMNLGEIQKHYAEGLAKHKISAMIK